MRALLISSLMVLTACAASSTKNASPRVERNVVTVEELARSGPQNLYTALQALRPHWLSKRGSTSIMQQETVKVYMDGSRLGGPESLLQISTHSIHRIIYLDALEATQQYGLDHGQGAILVLTRKEGRI